MNAGIKDSVGPGLLFGAAAFFIASCGWTAVRQAEMRQLRHRPITLARSGSVYLPDKWPRPEATSPAWLSPPAPASGSGWSYEVFTPPQLYYHATTADFSVVAPSSSGAETSREEGELIAVKPEPYRLQLMGYVGGPGDYRAVFVRPGQPGTRLIREGQRLPDLGLTLLRLTVKKIAEPPAVSAPAQAVLHDERSGEDVVLDCRTLRFTGDLLAVLRSAGERQSRDRRAGDDWTAGEVSYRIERIQLDPPLVVITRQGLDPSRPERQELHPVHIDHQTGRKLARSRPMTSGSTAALSSDRD